MLLQQIGEEYIKLNKIVLRSYDSFEKILKIYEMKNEEFTANRLINYSHVIRKMSKFEGILQGEKFISKSVQEHVEDFFDLLHFFYSEYDRVMDLLTNDHNECDSQTILEVLNDRIHFLKQHAWNVYTWYINTHFAGDMLLKAVNETWEPLPDDLELECEDIIISSETKGITLVDVSQDVKSLDSFMNNINFLINKDNETNYFLRKVETGSLSVVISCVTAATSIVSFIFFVIRLCQNTEKRALNNKEKRLKLIGENLDMAKKILDIDSQNTEANEIIQMCGLHILQYLENNPRGTINGESYDIGMEILKIEEKENK